MTTPQTCQAVGCTAAVERGRFMCRPHWFALPAPLRASINATWTARRKAGRAKGVVGAAREILDHVAACDEARRWTAEGEGKLAYYEPDAARLTRLYRAAQEHEHG